MVKFGKSKSWLLNRSMIYRSLGEAQRIVAVIRRSTPQSCRKQSSLRCRLKAIFEVMGWMKSSPRQIQTFSGKCRGTSSSIAFLRRTCLRQTSKLVPTSMRKALWNVLGAGLRSIWKKTSSQIERPHRISVPCSCGNPNGKMRRASRGFDPQRSPYPRVA